MSNRNMTSTYVGKGANRGAHSARTSKAAQRTPLPPKGATAGWRGGPGTAAEIIKEAIQEAKEQIVEQAKTAEAAAETGLPPKVAALIAVGFENGWSADTQPQGHDHIVSLAREGETIRVIFTDGNWSPIARQVFIRPDGSEVLLRNASAAKKQMAAEGDARPVPAATSSRVRTAVAEDEDEVPLIDLPAGFYDLADEALVAYLGAGVALTWRTPGTRILNEASVLAGSRVRIERNLTNPSLDRRIVHFVTGERQYRSLTLRSIVRAKSL